MDSVVSRLKYRHFLIGTIFVGVGVYPLFRGEFKLFSVLFIILGIGNFFKSNLARKTALVIYIIFMAMVVFGFFPPFTSGDTFPFNELNLSLRVMLMIGFEILILLQVLLLKVPYPSRKKDANEWRPW